MFFCLGINSCGHRQEPAAMNRLPEQNSETYELAVYKHAEHWQLFKYLDHSPSATTFATPNNETEKDKYFICTFFINCVKVIPFCFKANMPCILLTVKDLKFGSRVYRLCGPEVDIPIALEGFQVLLLFKVGRIYESHPVVVALVFTIHIQACPSQTNLRKTKKARR